MHPIVEISYFSCSWKELKLPRWSGMIKSNIKPTLVNCTWFLSNRRQIWVAKQLNKVYLYVSHVRWSQNTEHAKVLSYFTNKYKTRLDYRNSLNKNIWLNTFFFNWIKIYFLWEKIYIYIFIEYKYIFFESQTSYKTKIFFFIEFKYIRFFR